MKLVLFIGLCSLAPMAATAHHSVVTEYDTNARITITGSMVELKWINPHARLTLDAKDEAGRSVMWSVELGSPTQLANRFGWRSADVTSGSILTVDAYPNRVGAKRDVAAIEVTLPDGRRLFAGLATVFSGPPSQ